MLEHVCGHCRLAAELARQGPIRPDAIGQDTAEDPAARRGPGDLLDFGLAVDRIEADAERVGARDVPLFLNGVAIADAVRCGTGCQHHLDLGDRGSIEAGAQLRQQRQDLRRRIGLHGIEHPRVGQGLCKGTVVVANHVKVDDQARAFVITLT